jgi:hypothetical protein
MGVEGLRIGASAKRLFRKNRAGCLIDSHNEIKKHHLKLWNFYATLSPRSDTPY